MTIHAKDSTMYLTIDKCGRFVLPFCLRSAMGIHTGDKITLTPTDKGYLLMPAKHRCCICGSDSNLSSISFNNEVKAICKDCIVHIREYCNK